MKNIIPNTDGLNNKNDYLASPDAGSIAPPGATEFVARPDSGGGQRSDAKPRYWSEIKNAPREERKTDKQEATQVAEVNARQRQLDAMQAADEVRTETQLVDARAELKILTPELHAPSYPHGAINNEEFNQLHNERMQRLYGTTDRARYTLDNYLDNAIQSGDIQDIDMAKMRFVVFNHVIQGNARLLERQAIDQGIGRRGDATVTRYVNEGMEKYRASDAHRSVEDLRLQWSKKDPKEPIQIDGQSYDRADIEQAAIEVSVELFGVAAEAGESGGLEGTKAYDNLSEEVNSKSRQDARPEIFSAQERADVPKQQSQQETESPKSAQRSEPGENTTKTREADVESAKKILNEMQSLTPLELVLTRRTVEAMRDEAEFGGNSTAGEEFTDILGILNEFDIVKSTLSANIGPNRVDAGVKKIDQVVAKLAKTHDVFTLRDTAKQSDRLREGPHNRERHIAADFVREIAERSFREAAKNYPDRFQKYQERWQKKQLGEFITEVEEKSQKRLPTLVKNMRTFGITKDDISSNLALFGLKSDKEPSIISKFDTMQFAGAPAGSSGGDLPGAKPGMSEAQLKGLESIRSTMGRIVRDSALMSMGAEYLHSLGNERGMNILQVAEQLRSDIAEVAPIWLKKLPEGTAEPTFNIGGQTLSRDEAYEMLKRLSDSVEEFSSRKDIPLPSDT